MPGTRLEAHRVDDAEALALWSGSAHATVFNDPRVLRRFFPGVEWWGVERSNDVVAVWPVPVDGSGRPVSSGFFYYVGPLWSSAHFPPVAHRSLSGTLPVYEAFIRALEATYGTFVAALPPPQEDVRAFLWWRFEEGAPIRCTPRYSAVLDDLHLRPWEDLAAGFRQLRRRELRQATLGGSLEWGSGIRAAELADLYRQRVPGAHPDLDVEMGRLLAIVDDGAGGTVVARDQDGRAVAATVLLATEETVNLVINAVGSEYRRAGVGAHATARSIQFARESGRRRFDFNGANSPHRGDDKHSYGARPLLYFEVRLDPPLQ